ncbi:MAG TPA: EFR1 family ferrodoxin [Clostridia bacterium]
MIKNVNIVYYSGTGGAEKVSLCFKNAFIKKGYNVMVHHIREEAQYIAQKHELLLVIYAVHACNAPEAVYKWIKNIDKVDGISAVVISVSGGGEVPPNTGCRVSCIKKLQNKGYRVFYEDMIVMPSNWIVSTKESLALMLLAVLPEKVEKIVNDVLLDVTRRTRPLLIDRLFSFIGRLEKYGAKSFGKKIRVAESCSGCGWCADNCPSGNIKMVEGRPDFKGRCHMCLKCIYGCPCKALKAGFVKFVVIKAGYSMKELEKKLPYKEKVNLEEVASGYVWGGVRKYLSDFYKNNE